MKYGFKEVVLDSRTGLNPRKNFVLGNGNNNYITIKDIYDGKINISDKTDKVDDDAIQIIKKRSRIKVGDILFVSIGRIGETAIVSEKDDSWDVNESVFVFTVNEEIITPEYFCMLFRSDTVKDYLTGNSSGSTFKSIKMNQLERMVFDLPSLDIQRDITAKLVKIKDVCSLRTSQLTYFDELIKARFVELFGNPITNEKGWDTAELNSVCDGIGDGLHGTPEYDERGKYPFINGNNLMDGVIEITSATKMVNEETYKKHFIELTDNAVLISINGTLGKLAFYNGETVMLGKSACYCNLKPEINREFVYGVMKTDAFMRFLESNATASTIKNVGLKAIRGFRLILPPEELQAKFVEFSKQVDKSKVVVQKALEETRKLFDSLMQDYFG